MHGTCARTSTARLGHMFSLEAERKGISDGPQRRWRDYTTIPKSISGKWFQMQDCERHLSRSIYMDRKLIESKVSQILESCLTEFRWVRVCGGRSWMLRRDAAQESNQMTGSKCQMKVPSDREGIGQAAWCFTPLGTTPSELNCGDVSTESLTRRRYRNL